MSGSAFGSGPNFNNTTGAFVGIQGSTLGSSLEQMLMADQIVPGTEPSYELCKIIYLYHPLGAKLIDTPVKLAMSQPRIIEIGKAPQRVIDRFRETEKALGNKRHIKNVKRQSRMYGISTVAVGVKDAPTEAPLTDKQIRDGNLFFNVLDPLNTSGSLVLNQEPNSPDFQEPQAVRVQGQVYHQSRTIVVMNEEPIYINFTGSAFGFVGRSVFQRCLFPLKSFVQTMMTDDMVSQKAGVLVAKVKQPGSIVDNLMARAMGIKRALLKRSTNYNVISISPDEEIESLNLQNLDGAASMSRENIIKNVAIAADQPGKLLSNDVFVEGFGEGTEDAKHIAKYIDDMREEMEPIFDFFDRITMIRAWTPEFYETIQEEFEEYKGVSFEVAFNDWKNNFSAKFPNFLTEPPSEKAKSEKEKHAAIKDTVDMLTPLMDPQNAANVIEWAAANLNEMEELFSSPMVLDKEALIEWLEDKAQQAQDAQDALSMGGADTAAPADGEPDEEVAGESGTAPKKAQAAANRTAAKPKSAKPKPEPAAVH